MGELDYYNENDPEVAQWLRNLIAAGMLPQGDVDDRSIVDVSADDLAGYRRCHFFAGVGGWALAVDQAGIDGQIWTGSCPCQPFSIAGRNGGASDERHLWPIWFDLIRKCRPAIIFGEQVDAAVRFGWLDAVQADLEAQDYAFGAVVWPAAGIGAPHARHRIYWVADDNRGGRQLERGRGILDGERQAQRDDADGCGESVQLGDTASEGWTAGRASEEIRRAGESGRSSEVVRVGDPIGKGLEGQPRNGAGGDEPGRHCVETHGPAAAAGATSGFWGGCDWIPCIDGKARPVEPGTFPLAHGVPGRVVKLRAYGNAVVVPQAEAFVRAVSGGSGNENRTKVGDKAGDPVVQGRQGSVGWHQNPGT